MIKKNQVITITGVKYISKYTLNLIFNDHTRQTVDFYPFLAHSLNPLIRKYLTINQFKKYSITDGDLQWNDYDLCFPVADLYENNIHHDEALRQTA